MFLQRTIKIVGCNENVGIVEGVRLYHNKVP
jgi:hypothetical protein